LVNPPLFFLFINNLNAPQALEDHPLAADIAAAFDSLTPPENGLNLTGFTKVRRALIFLINLPTLF
jgi:hypothetical protein